MEGGGRGRPRQLLLSVSRLCSGRPLRARMGGDAELARGRCDVHDLGRGRLRRDARVRLQRDRLRQDRARRLLRHRPRNRRRARPHLRAVHDEDGDLRGRRHRGVRGAALAHAALLPPLWQPALGTGGEIPAALPVGIGSARDLGGQRGGASRLCHRDGAGGNGRQGPRPHSPPADADLRAAHAVLFHPCRLLRLHPRARRRPRRLRFHARASKSSARSSGSIRSPRSTRPRTRRRCTPRC